jgi:hypothetical protein
MFHQWFPGIPVILFYYITGLKEVSHSDYSSGCPFFAQATN